MKRLITDDSKKELINVYVNNWMFHNVVTRHELAGSNYKDMLEDAIVMMDKDIVFLKKLVINYANKYGSLDDEIKIK